MAPGAKDGGRCEITAVPVSQVSGAGAETANVAGRWLRTELLRTGETIELGSEGVRYEIVRSLGKGGMAEVFLARRLGAAGFVREVALKCITADLELDDRIRRAFICEAQLASRLRHPSIAAAYDLAEVGDRYYLVLEYIDGVSAESIIRSAQRQRKQLSEGLCCHLGAAVAEGLHYAHGLTDGDGRPLGIVHRDVTAANVMIARSGVVKLLDFGIAYARLQGRDRTETGKLKGTYAYFSPEQASGEALDGRSDLFSLGVLLVELLTGKRVFDSRNDAAAIRKISECERADVEAATSKLPRCLREICRKALAKKPEDRFQEGAEFARALRAYAFERKLAFLPSDCVKELCSLGAFTKGPGKAEAEEPPAESGIEASEGFDAQPSRPVEQRTERHQNRRWARHQRILAAAAVAVGVLSPALAMLLRDRNAGASTSNKTVVIEQEGEQGGSVVAAEHRWDSLPGREQRETISMKGLLLSSLLKDAPNTAVPEVDRDLFFLAALCAPNVAPETMAAVVRHESSGNPFAIGMTKGLALSRQPSSVEEAVATAEWLLERGYVFDGGLGQVNSRNLEWLNLKASELFEPCKNLRAAGRVLEECYSRAAGLYGQTDAALWAALSCYNTGTFDHGLANGYVTAVAKRREPLVPAIPSGSVPKVLPGRIAERVEPETSPAASVLPIKVKGRIATRARIRRAVDVFAGVEADFAGSEMGVQ